MMTIALVVSETASEFLLKNKSRKLHCRIIVAPKFYIHGAFIIWLD